MFWLSILDVQTSPRTDGGFKHTVNTTYSLQPRHNEMFFFIHLVIHRVTGRFTIGSLHKLRNIQQFSKCIYFCSEYVTFVLVCIWHIKQIVGISNKTEIERVSLKCRSPFMYSCIKPDTSKLYKYGFRVKTFGLFTYIL